ncbi:MAG: hypothetical protein ACRDRL_25810 [Sciscionella sp.]
MIEAIADAYRAGIGNVHGAFPARRVRPTPPQGRRLRTGVPAVKRRSVAGTSGCIG